MSSYNRQGYKHVKNKQNNRDKRQNRNPNNARPKNERNNTYKNANVPQQRGYHKEGYENRNYGLRINSSMRRLRQVSPRFFESKQRLVELFQPHTMNDDNNWSNSQGDGITYSQLLKLPFYEDQQKLPENIVKTKDEYRLKSEKISWDGYFNAIKKNYEGGYVPKYHNMKRPK